jgi:hypothetical protein
MMCRWLGLIRWMRRMRLVKLEEKLCFAGNAGLEIVVGGFRVSWHNVFVLWVWIGWHFLALLRTCYMFAGN